MAATHFQRRELLSSAYRCRCVISPSRRLRCCDRRLRLAAGVEVEAERHCASVHDQSTRPPATAACTANKPRPCFLNQQRCERHGRSCAGSGAASARVWRPLAPAPRSLGLAAADLPVSRNSPGRSCLLLFADSACDAGAVFSATAFARVAPVPAPSPVRALRRFIIVARRRAARAAASSGRLWLRGQCRC